MKIAESCTLVIIFACISLSDSLYAQELPRLTGPEVEALALTLKTFKSQQGYSYEGSVVYGDISHYTIALERHGETVDITFVPQQSKEFKPNEAGTGGGTVYGWEVHYSVSLKPLKILKEDYAR
jgi:hypothetical protein